MIPCQSQPIAPLRPLLHGVALLLAGILLPFVWLREEPSFWTHAGGYPVWLRQAVLVGFYPLLLLQTTLLAVLSWHLFCRPSRLARMVCVEAVLLVLHWGVLAVVVLMMVANNITNLIDGRPLHDHPVKSVATNCRANFEPRS